MWILRRDQLRTTGLMTICVCVFTPHLTLSLLVWSRAAEEAMITDLDENNPGTEWERVARLCDFNPTLSSIVAAYLNDLSHLYHLTYIHWCSLVYCSGYTVMNPPPAQSHTPPDTERHPISTTTLTIAYCTCIHT
ncbi:Clathrin light chain A [Merluccius polli]|uniref:Clathrin light chain n=1 Tax=Merluccius polli TaxID=89951 RepID=A0AA47MPW7_MERPO|nr:Clathrin light chain A [Merluccius polli]KAK0145369.1 Clathrin light chain A [Merluccius polli]